MEKFSMLAVTCALLSLIKIIKLVKAENVLFQQGVDVGYHYFRKLHVSFHS